MSIEQIETGSFIELTNRTEPPQQLRIVSWNIARGTCLDAVVEFLSSVNADLILLQEVDTNSRRTGYRNVAKELSQKLRMNYAFGIEFQELAQGSANSPAYHGQATLSRWQLSSPRIMRFNDQSKFWHPYWWIPRLALLERRLGGRMALVTEVCVGNRSLVAYNVHLESRNGDDLRSRQLSELLDDALSYDRGLPLVIGGDFNFDVHQAPQRLLLWHTGLTNPFVGHLPTTITRAVGRQRSIDCILTRGELRRVSAEVHQGVYGSDHYPLSLTVCFEEAAVESDPPEALV